MRKGEEMTAYERLKRILEGKSVDRAPVIPQVLEHAIRIAGMKVSEVFRSPEKVSRAQLRALDRYGYDAVWGGCIDMYTLLAAAFGCEVSIPDDDVPDIKGPIAGNLEETEKLDIPDPKRDARLPMSLEIVHILSKELGNDIPVLTGLAGPFSVAANLRGITSLMGDLVSNPDLVKNLCQKTTKACKVYGKALLESGAAAIFLVDALAGPAIIGPSMFRKFVFPYHQNLVETLLQEGALIIYHVDVGIHLVLDDVSHLGVHALMPEDTEDIKNLRKLVGEETTLVGVVGPTALRSESPENLVSMSKTIIKKGRSKKGKLIFFTGMVPLDTPPENLEAVVRAAKNILF